MPEATRSFPYQPIEPTGASVDLLAQALDDLVQGRQSPRIDDAPLASLATSAELLQRSHGIIHTSTGPVSPTRIDRARKRQIWEDLMNGASRKSAGDSPAPVRLPSVASMNPWVEDEEPASRWEQIAGPPRRASTTGVLRFIPDIQPTTTFLMVIALLVAIGAGFSSLGQPGGPGITPTASATGDRGIAAAASPGATPGIDALFRDPDVSIECPVEPRPREEVAAFLQDPGPVSERAYLPVTDPDPAITVDVAQVGRAYFACAGEGQEYRRALETPRKIYEDAGNTFPKSAEGGFSTVSVEEQKALSGALLDPDPGTYFIPSKEVWTAQAGDVLVPGDPDQVPITMLPSHIVQLADGRIGGPAFWLVHPEDGDSWAESGRVLLDFLIFAPDDSRDGQWAVDESLLLCAGDCDAFWALASELDPATPVAETCPVAPVTSEQAAAIRDRESTLPERQYAPVTTADTATAHDVRSAFDRVGSCSAEIDSNPLYAYAFWTDRFIQENAPGFSSMDLIERWRAVSEQYGEALLGDQPSEVDLDVFLNIHAAQDRSPGSDFELIGAMDAHPQIVRLLPDGRAAVYSADVWLNRTGRIQVPTPVPGREVFGYTIFARQDGTWLLDESLMICLGECDSLWAEMSRTIGTPATPSGSPVATPAAMIPTTKRDPA